MRGFCRRLGVVGVSWVRSGRDSGLWLGEWGCMGDGWGWGWGYVW